MKRELSAPSIAVCLILAAVGFRLLSSVFPTLIPNISPLMAIAFVGAMYLPRAWGWLVGPSTLLITDLAFITTNARVDGSPFSWWTVISFVVYALAGGLGIFLARHKTFLKVVAGSLLCSVVFYLVGNTFSWLGNLAPATNPGYPANLAGWWQANTFGLPSWIPTWTFLRNAIAGDLFFAVVLVLILDRALIFRDSRFSATAQQA